MPPAPANPPVPPAAQPPLLYRPNELAEVLKCSRQSVYNKMALGLIPAKKFGDMTVVLHEDVMTMLRALPAAAYNPAPEPGVNCPPIAKATAP
jgi:hypothetical protein